VASALNLVVAVVVLEAHLLVLLELLGKVLLEVTPPQLEKISVVLVVVVVLVNLVEMVAILFQMLELAETELVLIHRTD
jgi:ABC-type nickel/cobalt efflux system permease component RcnA